jgi:ferredoxin
MAYVIDDNCICCGVCESTCPTNAIKEGDSKYVIDPEVCISCGACCDSCPQEAISEA